MIIRVYSVLDRKAHAFGALLFFRMMIWRCAVHETMSQANDMSRYPEDFEMYHVGMFDTSSGELSGNGLATLVCRFADFKEV